MNHWLKSYSKFAELLRFCLVVAYVDKWLIPQSNRSTQKKKFGGCFSIFAGFWNQFTFEIGCFKLTFQVTLLKCSNLKTLQSKINIVKNMCACFREKYQIVSLSTFNQCVIQCVSISENKTQICIFFFFPKDSIRSQSFS